MALAVLWGPFLFADVSIRYETTLTPAAALQPMMAQLLKAAEASSTSIRMKGNQGYTTAGSLVEIFDFTKQEVTLVDPAHKTFATLPASQLGDKVAAAMPQADSKQTQAIQDAMGSIKANIESKVTGNTAEIQGVRSEEREVTITMDLPVPAGPAQNGPGVKIVLHVWSATKEEALRVPAIRELTGYQAWQRYMVDPAASLNKLLGKMPGMSNTIGPLLNDLFKNQSVVMRTQMDMYMPLLAEMAKNMAKNGPTLAAIDPNAPLIEMKQEAVELSTAPVDASLFEIPKDYTAAPVEDMVREMIKTRVAAAK